MRGGSHSVPGSGTCDGGVVAGLSGMRGVRVDPARRTARLEGGAAWGDYWRWSDRGMFSVSRVAWKPRTSADRPVSKAISR
ncbi:FAD-binding protein [Streptomyces sp. ISL-21]|uniref:FAD-binding protein n=1 Tax=Streptomyces sp. ISL-21 TaxID=2819179 RepID=UPI0035ABD84F